MDSSVRSLSMLVIVSQNQELEIVEIWVKEGVDLSFVIKDSLWFDMVL